MTDSLSPRDVQAIRRAFERVSVRGWGVALGILSALTLFLATAVLVIKGGPDVGTHLGLLSNYFPGYDVNWFGAFIGAFYAFLLGYIAGSTVGWVYNWVVDRA